MILMCLGKLHRKIHNLAHPFEHVAHGGLIILIVLIVKLIAELVFFIKLQLNSYVIVLGFIGTIAASLFLERKYLKRL